MIEICVDNFAGGGGASQGIEAALGRPIDIAINHDAEAIAMHKANHPHTQHYEENVWKVDPAEATKGQRVGLGWFSPDCKHFSKAKGGKPVDKKIRGLAWATVMWAKATKMRVFVLENVEEFADWGPVLDDGTPCPLRKGLTFRRWWKQLENLGYTMEMRELRACDYGAPTTRNRLFIIGRCDGLPIAWPKPTHGFQFVPYRTAAECIDWSLPCPSIFLAREEGRALGVKRPLAEATMRRIARGIMRYVINSPRPFIVPLTHQGGDRVHGIDEPFRAITAAHRGELALACPTLIQMGYGEREGQAPRCLDLHKPLGTVVAQGNKHALVAAFLARHYGGHENAGAALFDPMHTITTQDHHALVTAHIQRDFGQSIGQNIETPLGTITANGGGKAALVASSIVKLKGTCRDGQPVDQPLHTIQAGGFHYGEVRAFLLKYYGTDQDPRLELPLGTVTTKDRFGLVTVHGEEWAIADIGMRMLTPRELFRAQGFGDDYIIDPLILNKETGKLKPLSKTGQIRMCGNSVCPPVAEALVRANYAARQLEEAA